MSNKTLTVAKDKLATRMESAADILEASALQLRYGASDIRTRGNIALGVAEHLMAFSIPAMKTVMVPRYSKQLESDICQLVWPDSNVALVRRRCKHMLRKRSTK